MDLTSVFPQPVPVRLGPLDVLAGPLRLKDLARLQAFLRDLAPCPLDELRPAIDAAPEGSERRRRLLRDAFLAQREWPARLGTPAGMAALLAPGGLEFWLSVVLAEWNPGLTPADVEAIAGGVTVPQYATLSRVAHGADPMDELNRLLSPDSFPPPKGGPSTVNWGEVAAEVIELTGWTFEQFGECRVTQLAAIRSRGRAGTAKVPIPPGMAPGEFRRRQKAKFGPDRDVDLDTVEG